TDKEHIVELRRHFWDDVTVNTSNLDEAVETLMSIKQQEELLAERERSYRQGYKQMEMLKRMLQAPYFGRIDFEEDGEGRTERIYIGIASLRDEDDLGFLIYDWRAPISGLY